MACFDVMRCLISVDTPLSGELHLVTCGFKLCNYACALCNTGLHQPLLVAQQSKTNSEAAVI